MSLTKQWSEADCLSRIMLSHAPRQATVSLTFDVRQKMKSTREQIESTAEREDVIAFARRWIAAQDAKEFDPSVELVEMGAEEWIAAIVAIARKTEEDRRHDPNLAAGLFEDFLGKHGEEYFEVVAELARRWPRFRYLLGGVWQGSMKKGLWHRIEAIRGQPW